MQVIRPSQVPEYLHNSSFFKGLDITNDDEFSIPRNHMKLSMSNVDTLADMTELLNTVRFWGLNILPQSLLDFAARRPYKKLQPMLETYRTDLPFLTAICSIFAGTVDTSARLEKAMENGRVKVLRFIHQTWGGKFSARALSLAAGNGALDCLQYALKTVNSSQFDRQYKVFVQAVRNGQLECIRCLEANGFGIYHWPKLYDPAKLAAASGQYAILMYLGDRRFSMRAAAIAAADAGHWDCLVYAIQCGAPLRGEPPVGPHNGSLAERLARANQTKLFPFALSRECPVSAATVSHLAKAGNLQCMKVCIERGAQLSIRLIVAAAEKGHLACLQYLHQVCAAKEEVKGKALSWLAYAAAVGNSTLRPADVAQLTANAQQWECLRFVIEQGCEMNKSLTTCLVKADQIELYHLAVIHGCEVSVPAACQFSKDGNLSLLQHALEHGCERSVEILRAAARHGQLQCLIYARTQSCPWSVRVTLEAARGGQLECLKYLHEHGCPWDVPVRGSRHKKCILDYASVHGCPF